MTAAPNEFGEFSTTPITMRGWTTEPRPWTRWAARTVDMWIFLIPLGFAGGVAIGLLAPDSETTIFDTPGGDLAFAFVLTFVWMALDAVVLAMFGTTPGKAMLGLRVRRVDGQKPAIGETFKRSMLLFVCGLGLSIPIIALIEYLYWYGALKKKGVTVWDRVAGLRVEYRPAGVWRTVLGAVIIIGFGAFLIWLQVAESLAQM